MKKKVFILFLVVLMVVSGCGRNTNSTTDIKETESSAYTFTDDLGREVTVENPKRVAALLGSYADLWVLAGGEVHASADDAWEDFHLDMPEDAVNLGKTKEISLEKLFEAQPDFILASTNTRVHMEWKETLEQTGIPVAYFDVSDFDDYLRILKICTDITGRTDLYEKNVLEVQKQIEDIVLQSEERINAHGIEKVLVVRVSAAMILAKNSQDNVLGEMLKSLGCENIADSHELLLENLSMEYILQEDPDSIFVLQIGDDIDAIESHFEKYVQENPAWNTLTAVKEGRVYIMDKTLYNLKPNDRWGEAYEKLEKILRNGENK